MSNKKHETKLNNGIYNTQNSQQLAYEKLHLNPVVAERSKEE